MKPARIGRCDLCPPPKKGDPVLDKLALLQWGGRWICAVCFLRWRIDVCDRDGCQAPAPFGIGWDFRRGIAGRWFCGPHYREECARLAEAKRLDITNQYRMF